VTLTDQTFAELMDPLGPFESAPHLAVGVSGGADSLALVLLAARWARARGGTVTALTVDHGLRPEAAAEAEQVGRWMAERDIPHGVLRGTVPLLPRNIQAEARALRHALLRGWCQHHGCLHLLLAHNLEDQAETLLLRLARPWRLQLLVGRNVGALERVYTTFESGWQPPAHLLRDLPQAATPAPLAFEQDENAAMTALWQRIWRDKSVEIAGLGAMLLVLTGAFFFQTYVTVSERAFYRFRMGFLVLTLVFLGWYANAQLSVVNIMALASSLKEGFTWSAFMLDPLTFILWFSVAASLIFWGRGAYCGWLCPFGALQELTNQIARRLRVPQWTLPWGLHERLWAVKYILFLGLFGVSLASIEQAETLAEVEPFKTAIVLKFDRAWPFVLYALVLLGAGLFVERFYCRYLCPLGGALAIPARMRMFDWLRRYRECGNPCQTCANECFVQAIHPTGEINPNECLNCLHCQVLYQSQDRCPVVIKRLKRRAATSESAAGAARVLTNHPNLPNLKKGTDHV